MDRVQDIAKRLPAHLERRYGIKVDRVAPIEGGHLFRVDRPDGPSWVARPFPPERPVERVEGDAAILRHLEDVGYPAERVAHRDPVSEIDGWSVLLTSFVEGRLPGNGGRANVPVETLRTLGEMLGRIHNLPAETDAMKRPGGSWHGDAQFEGSPREDVAAARTWLAEVEDRIADHGRAALATLRGEIDALDDGADLPHAFVHPDFCAVNVVATRDDRLVAVDWTGSGWGPRIASLAILLSSTQGAPRGSVSDAVGAAMAGYASHVQLETAELDRIGAVMRIRTVLFACYTYRLSVMSGHTPTGGEGWWPNHRSTDAIAEQVRRAV